MTWTGPNEPVRKNGLVAGLIVAGSTFFGGIAVALGTMDEVTVLSAIVVLCGALGSALAQLGVVAGFTNSARHQVYGPETVDEIMDAESVIAAAERGEHG